MTLPRPPLDLNAWARRNVVFGEESQFKGPWNSDLFPFFVAILEAAGPDDPCRVVVLMKSAQLGGSVIAQVFLLGSIDEDPGFLLYVHPTEDNATRWAKTKLRPMIRQTPAASRCFGPNAFANLTYIERADGRGAIQVSGASSPSSLSMVSMARQVQDDLAKWETTNAGDPEELADSRSMAFIDAKILKLSTPLVHPGCRITRAFHAGTQEYYHVPCPHCGHEHPLEWENFKENIDRDHPERSHFVCPECGGVIEQRHRFAMNLAGKWVAKNPKARNRCRSFHLWTAYSPLVDWSTIAERYLKAEGDPAAEKTFFNDVLGLPYEEGGGAPDWQLLFERAEKNERRRGIIPCRHPILTIGVDCQGDRVEWQAQAFGPGRRIATVDYGVIQGHISEDVCRERLDDLLKRTWKNEAGNNVEISLLAIDANAYTDDVLDWSKRHAKAIATRGDPRDSAPEFRAVRYERNRKGDQKRRGRRWFNVGVSGLKSARYKMLQKTDPLERGYVDIPRGMGEVFFQQYVAERRIPKKQKIPTAYTPYVWTLADGERNEVLDTAIYGEAAAIRVGIREFTPERWEALIAEKDAPPPEGPQLDMEALLARPAPPPKAEGVATPPAAASEKRTGSRRFAH